MATGTVSAVIRAHQRRLVTFAISLVFAVAALPALAQQQESTQNVLPPPYYGYGHMMWGGPGPGWGWHPFMIVGPIFAVLAVIGTVVIFVWLVHSGNPWLSVPPSRPPSLLWPGGRPGHS